MSQIKSKYGNLVCNVEQIPYYSFGPYPDPNWEYTDQAGHIHKYDDKENVPTTEWIETEGVWFDIDGEEYGPAGELRCKQCGEAITPGQREEPWTHYIPGEEEWSLDGKPITAAEGQALYKKILKEAGYDV